jgi:hypothetical protein
MVWVLPVCTLADVGLTLTETAGGGGAAVTVKIAAAVLLVSVTDLAVRVIVAGDGIFAGAVYVTELPDALDVEESEPQEDPEQPEPLSVQVTPLLPLSF